MMASAAPLNLDEVIDNQSVRPTTILFLAIAMLATKVGIESGSVG